MNILQYFMIYDIGIIYVDGKIKIIIATKMVMCGNAKGRK